MYQKVAIIGRLGKDPEFKQLNNGITVCSFSVAVTKKLKDREDTEWFNCNCWQKLAEVARDYLVKGGLVFCEGELKTSKYKDKQGNEASRVDLNVFVLKMLNMPGQNQTKQENKQPPKQEQPRQDDFFVDNLSF